jgi:hypothetical protein
MKDLLPTPGAAPAKAVFFTNRAKDNATAMPELDIPEAFHYVDETGLGATATRVERKAKGCLQNSGHAKRMMPCWCILLGAF